jgi:recombination protein RecR
MIDLPESIKNSVISFSKLPGVGEKTALRQVMNMVKWSIQDLDQFSHSINELKSIKRCAECGLYSEKEICEICKNEYRKIGSI